MKYKNALESFKHMSQSILADGKVDMNEAKMLKEFIYPYVLQGNTRFIEFNMMIDKYMEDGQITKDESDELIKLINDISLFLKIDNFVCNTMMFLFFGFIVGALILKYLI